ncbi:hypothetical protein Taro_018274 [Colocasia esculenta]|uniref:RNA-dependent RNA polymerase n=1 Tax=Colocasia esculenta TaxID=4460 RepID=A0A843UTG3_COLES|nr:hypothetical protein [Colocasia esculenta]
MINTLVTKKAFCYRFTKGQPLGFDSSWPVFALTHHALVWLTAWRALPGKEFLDYVILGDDLVIGHPKWLKEYVKIMNDCEVTILKEKSLISSTGALEFTKKFITDKDSMDLSPVSLKVLNIFSGFTPAFHFHLLGVNLRTSIRLRGGGYPVYNNEGISKGS